MRALLKDAARGVGALGNPIQMTKSSFMARAIIPDDFPSRLRYAHWFNQRYIEIPIFCKASLLGTK